jgi:hypothetical protein
MSLPNFLLIGAAKSGTTALFDYLAQHPDVFVPELKEPRFFAYEGRAFDPRDPVRRRTVTDLSSYVALFDGAGSAQAIGEASPSYLTTPEAPVAIRAHIPDVRLLVILRDPAERAWSHFNFSKERGFERADATFDDVFAADQVDLGGFQKRRPYLRTGRYAEHLGRYFALFRGEQIRVLLFDDFARDPAGVARDAYRFLGLPDFSPTESVRRNATGSRRRWLARWLPASKRKQPLPPDLRAKLVDYYRDDIARTQDLIGRDLTSWLTV